MDEEKYSKLVWISVFHNNLSFELQNTLPQLIKFKIESSEEVKKMIEEIIQKLGKSYHDIFSETDTETKLTLIQAGFRLNDYR